MRLFSRALFLLLPCLSANAADNAAPLGAATRSNADIAWYGMYAGILGITVIFSLALWIWRRDRAYAWYSATTAFIGIVVAFSTGFAGQYIPSGLLTLAAAFQAIFSVLACASAAFTIGAVLQLRESAPLARRWLTYAVTGSLACLLLAPWVSASALQRVADLLALLLLASSLLASVIVFALRPPLRLHAAVFLPLHIGGMAFFLHSLDILWESRWLEHSLESGSAVSMVLLGLLLAGRARQTERDQDIARRQALESALKSERLLEQRVGERTAELFQANALLQIEINERRKLEKELQAALATERNALRAQRQFVSMVSHEFRTPLAIIDTTAQRLDTALEQHMPDLAPRITKIRRAVARLLTLIDNCLSEDRLSTHDMTLRLEIAPPEKLLRRVAQDAPVDRPDRIRIELADGLRPVMCDAHLIGIALTNLVKNALNYSPPDTVVTLCARAGEHSLEIEVDDEGPGVAADEKEAIFDKFYRSERTQTVSGAGLGLYLCREIARSHGGDVMLVEKNGPGACFRLTLPYATEEEFIPQAV